MRLLKLFLILTFLLPLCADDKENTPSPTKTQVEEPAKKTEPPVVEQTEPAKTEESAVHKATESYENAFIKTIVVLVGLVVLIILTVWMFKKVSNGRFKSFNYHKSIKVLEKRPLSPKSMLYLVDVRGKEVLIAESQFEVRAITTLDWVEENKDL